MASQLNLAPGPVARAYEYWVRRLAEREGRGRSDAAVRAAEAAARAPNPTAKQSEKRGEVEEKRKTKGEETMSFCRTLAVALFALGSAPAAAQDTLKIAIGQINNWENQAPTLGEDAGIFKKHNLKIESFGTQGAGETIQAVVSGSADLGAGVGVAGVMRAFSARRAGARAAAGLHRHRRPLLVREGGLADQDRSPTRPRRTRSRIRPADRARTTSWWRSARSSA